MSATLASLEPCYGGPAREDLTRHTITDLGFHSHLVYVISARSLCANVAETPTPRMITVQGGGGTSDDEQPQHSAGGDPGAEGGRA